MRIDHAGVFIKVFPYPRRDVERVRIKKALRSCGIKNTPLDKPCNDAVASPKVLRPCFFVEIPRQNFLFLEGEGFQARDLCFRHKTYTVFLDAEKHKDGGVVEDYDAEGNYKGAAKIHFQFFAPLHDTQIMDKAFRREQSKAARRQYWKKVIGWGFKNGNNFQKPQFHSNT